MKDIIKHRPFKNEDINQVLNIYNFHIINGLSNFEEKPYTYDNFLKLTKDVISSELPFIVSIMEEKIIGFAYLNKFRDKSGYKHTFENSIYVDNDYIGKGIGSLLLKNLINKAKKNSKIKTIIAVIGKKNSSISVKIHQNNGFDIVGTLKKVGYKKKQWLDVIYMQKTLNEKN